MTCDSMACPIASVILHTPRPAAAFLLSSPSAKQTSHRLQHVDYDEDVAAFTCFGHGILSQKRNGKASSTHYVNLKPYRHFISIISYHVISSSRGRNIFLHGNFSPLFCVFHLSHGFLQGTTHNNFLCMLKIIHILCNLSMANWHFPSDPLLPSKLLSPNMT